MFSGRIAYQGKHLAGDRRRVVLYHKIDDQPRCRPKDNQRVLGLIHLKVAAMASQNRRPVGVNRRAG